MSLDLQLEAVQVEIGWGWESSDYLGVRVIHLSWLSWWCRDNTAALLRGDNFPNETMHLAFDSSLGEWGGWGWEGLPFTDLL